MKIQEEAWRCMKRSTIRVVRKVLTLLVNVGLVFYFANLIDSFEPSSYEFIAVYACMLIYAVGFYISLISIVSEFD